MVKCYVTYSGKDMIKTSLILKTSMIFTSFQVHAVVSYFDDLDLCTKSHELLEKYTQYTYLVMLNVCHLCVCFYCWNSLGFCCCCCCLFGFFVFLGFFFLFLFFLFFFFFVFGGFFCFWLRGIWFTCMCIACQNVCFWGTVWYSAVCMLHWNFCQLISVLSQLLRCCRLAFTQVLLDQWFTNKQNVMRTESFIMNLDLCLQI